MDEKGLDLAKTPKILRDQTKKQTVSLMTVTVIGGGNALGSQVTPYSYFPGARMYPTLMDDATPASRRNTS